MNHTIYRVPNMPNMWRMASAPGVQFSLISSLDGDDDVVGDDDDDDDDDDDQRTRFPLW